MHAAWTSPCAQRARPPARGAPRTSRPTSRASRSPAGAARAHGGHGGVYGRGRRPRRPASPERPRARGMDVPVRTACASPLRAARRGRRALPAGASRPPPGRHGRMAVTGAFVVGADVPGGPRPRDVPVRAACASPARGAPRTSRPTSWRIPAPRRGGTGAWRPRGVCGRGRRPRRPASPERPRAHSVRGPLRAARRGRRALPAAHPVPLCRETLPPPGRCGHERTAARCAILFSLRGTDERGRVPVRGVHHGTAKRRKPKRPCV